MGIHYLQKLHASNVPKELVEIGQNRVIEASLTLIRERAKLKVCMTWKNVILSGVCMMRCFSLAFVSSSFY